MEYSRILFFFFLLSTLTPFLDAEDIKSRDIGIYFGGGIGSASVKKLPPVTTGGGTLTPANPNSDCAYAGVGLRYFISKKWMADAAIMPALIYGYNFAADPAGGKVHINGIMIRLLADRLFFLSEKFSAHAGAGAMSISGVKISKPDNDGAVRLSEDNDSNIIPFVRLGLEWKIQPLLGWAVFGSYNLAQNDYKYYSLAGGNNTKVLIRQFASPRLMFETTMSFYFE
ncbi:MAG TPA: hypothetical protein DCL44_04175 [Elusimicrobia bacterium]|nr:hypothetical protein [Elusimicrobiota bacterium]